jgi:hypothetical protein
MKKAQTQEKPPKETPAEADRRKVRTALALVLIKSGPAILVAVAVITAALLFLPIFGKPIINLVQTEERSVSDLVLSEVRQIARLNAVEFHYKVVFPFDFQAEGVSEMAIIRKLQKAFNKSLEEMLSPDERVWLQAVNLARRNGLNPYQPDYHFLVATVIIKAGFNLDQGNARFVLTTRQEEGKTIRSGVLSLPEPLITAIEVEDPDRVHYPFPDLPLSPQGWKEIAGFVQEHYVSQSLREGLLQQARDKLQSWLRPLLIPAACDEISFIQAER